MTVTEIQARLKTLGVYGGPIDGNPSNALTDAVRAYQRAIGITSDGIAGPITQGHLMLDGTPKAAAAGEPIWIPHARKFLGTHEGYGAADNPVVMRMYAQAGSPGIAHDAVPWCAAFVSAVLEDCGIRSARTLWAPSYAVYGQKLGNPIYGCIGVKLRHGGGHVTFIVGASGGVVFGLGGNQGDSVSVAAFAKDDFIAWRWPLNIAIPATPHPMPASIAGARAGQSEA